jgi:hypothetical protein
MDCQAINREELAEKYVHRRLDAAQMDAFETHLLECSKCAKELEALQVVQVDLAERAHEIRGWTSSKPHFFRWQVVVLAGIVIVVATASIVVRWQKMQTASVTAPPPPQTKPPLGETVAKGHETNPAGEAVKTQGPQNVPRESGKMQAAQANSPSQIGDLPINTRNYRDLTLIPTGASRDTAPSIGPAPTSGLNMAGGRARENQVNADGKEADNSRGGAKAATQAAEENSQPTRTPIDSQRKQELTTAQAVELYHLASVVAPPFTFSGFSTKHQMAFPGHPNSHARGGQNAESDRKIFREAMNAYIASDYRSAGELLVQAAKVEPNAADVQFYLGVCRLVNGHATEAVQPLKRAGATDNLVLRQEAHYYLAKAYLQDMNLGEAEDEFRAASELSGPLKTDSTVLLARMQALRAQVGKN